MVSEGDFSMLNDIVILLQALRVCVTGAAGQIAYSLLYSVAKGDVFGADQVRCNSPSYTGAMTAPCCDGTRRGYDIYCHFCITT